MKYFLSKLLCIIFGEGESWASASFYTKGTYEEWLERNGFVDAPIARESYQHESTGEWPK